MIQLVIYNLPERLRSMNKIFGRLTAIMAAAAVLALAANISNGNISFGKKPDALTSATVKNKGETVSMPGVDGNFIILINKDKTPAGTLDYFTGKGSAVDGLSSHVPKGDEKAVELAHKMTADVTEDDPLMLLSKAEYGDFDILIFSKKIADKYTAKSLYDKEFTQAVELKGE